ncbi:MAG TPA: D-sedoheptulose 7-phosphate isomerase [Bacteroidia bacterium]|nr:D-sedoheptulose 7-phosphate isomerase [Bacteroidia bacterium]
MIQIIKQRLNDSINLKMHLLKQEDILQQVEATVLAIIKAYQHDGKVLWCGNGGSAADAQHLAAELSGRFYYDRPPLFSEALHVNTSYTTAVANDYSYDVIYSRLVEAMGRKGDVLIGLSTSGNSKNVIRAIEKANAMGLVTIGFTGQSGGQMASMCTHCIRIPSTDTPRIQECHMNLGHTICELTESALFPKK